MPGEVSFSRLLSADDPATAAELLAEVRPQERAPEGRPFVFVNMVSTIDGRAQVSGRTRELGDAGIVRNRAKIEAVIANARAAASLGAPLADLLWSFAPPERPAPRSRDDVPATTPESTAMAKELKRRGFRFVGPTTAYALMQACGLVNDHLAGCIARPATEAAQAAVVVPGA